MGRAFHQFGVPAGQSFLHGAQVVGIIRQEQGCQFGEQFLIVPDPGEGRFLIEQLGSHGFTLCKPHRQSLQKSLRSF
jgi:hypothetical protein